MKSSPWEAPVPLCLSPLSARDLLLLFPLISPPIVAHYCPDVRSKQGHLLLQSVYPPPSLLPSCLSAQINTLKARVLLKPAHLCFRASPFSVSSSVSSVSSSSSVISMQEKQLFFKCTPTFSCSIAVFAFARLCRRTEEYSTEEWIPSALLGCE